LDPIADVGAEEVLTEEPARAPEKPARAPEKPARAPEEVRAEEVGGVRVANMIIMEIKPLIHQSPLRNSRVAILANKFTCNRVIQTPRQIMLM